MPRNGSSSRLQVSAEQADGLPGGDEINLLNSEGLWVYKVPIRKIKMEILVTYIYRMRYSRRRGKCPELC